MSGSERYLLDATLLADGRRSVEIRSPSGSRIMHQAIDLSHPDVMQRLYEKLSEKVPWSVELAVTAAFPFEHWRYRARPALIRALVQAAREAA